MAFSFGNTANTLTGGGTTQGPDLELIQTEGLGFLALAGDAKVQLTSKWTDLPSPTASLISIASRKGLVAAAGPDAVHIATTESARKAFQSPKNGDSETRPFVPQAKLPLPIRISQLAFTADEQHLIISAETGGALAVYDVQALSQGSTQPVMEISTSGETLRSLIPNPMPEMAELCIAVTNNGNLLMANLKQRGLISGPNGPVLKSQVSCAAWSTKGKQLVAGLADGSMEQMTPDGTVKAQIPKPPSLGNYHVASIVWLENNVFLVVHNVTNGEPPSVYHIITRQQEIGSPASFVFQKLTDPVEPYGSEKKPHHTILRLRDFPPNLKDLLMVSSTSREAIGLVTRSTTPLTSDVPAEKITNVFTTTEFADDSKRAQLPMGDDYMDTFPIGTALDLSSKDKVYKPIPTDEIDESPGPLPGLWVLNNEGVLAVWWIVYNESVRTGTTYPEITAIQTGAPAANPQAGISGLTSSPTPAPAFGGTSVLGAKTSPWGTVPTATTSPASAFGSKLFGSNTPASSAPAFGAPSFGTPSALGSGTQGAPAFGQSSVLGGLGAKPSPWGAAAGGTAAATPSFGQSGFGSSSAAPGGKIFGSGATSSSLASGGGFSAFANKGGFASLASSTSPSGGGSIFGSGKPSGVFASSGDTAFPPKAATVSASSASPFGSSPFVLNSTFKPDPKTANDNEKPSDSAGGSSLFGSGFGLSLGDAAAKSAPTPEIKDADMDTETTETPAPAPAPAPAKESNPFAAATSTTAPKSMFGTPNESSASSDRPSPFGPITSASGTTSSIFGFTKDSTIGTSSSENPNPFVSTSSGMSTTPTTTPAPSKFLPATSTSTSAPFSSSGGLFGAGFKTLSSTSSSGDLFGAPTKVESGPSTPKGGSFGDPKTKAGGNNDPLPPESTKSPEPDDEAAAVPEEAPLPPDPIKEKSKYKTEDFQLPPGLAAPKLTKPQAAPPLPLAPEAAPDSLPKLPSEDDNSGLDDGEASGEEGAGGEGDDEQEEGSVGGSEGSGVDVAKDLSPTATSGFSQTPGFTPQSSFGGVGSKPFSLTINDPSSRPRLFGEVGRTAPLFPQPRVTSPRSPSPVRGGAIPARMLRPEAGRSVSAPGVASQILGSSMSGSGSGAIGKKNSVLVMSGAVVPKPPPPVCLTPDPNVEQQRRSQAKKVADEFQVLSDHEDAWKQELLSAPLQPTLELAEWLPNAGHIPEAVRTIPSQAEAMYRDINRMVDTLGLNARHLKEFIMGHTGHLRDDKRRKTKEDLEIPDDWILCDAEDVGPILDRELGADLESGRVKEFEDLMEQCRELAKDVGRLRIKEMDLRRDMASRSIGTGGADSAEQASAVRRSLPLSAEQAAQQADLRRMLTHFSKLLVEAEGALSLLKVRMASVGAVGSVSGNSDASASPRQSNGPPTVEAVMRTVQKMTSMIEKRSGDVDVLENQMRKLGLHPGGSLGSSVIDGGNGSRENNSPYTTPQKRLSRSFVFSPGSSGIGPRTPIAAGGLGASVASIGSPGGRGGTPRATPRKKLSGFTEAEKLQVRDRMQRRAAVVGKLRESLQKAGPNVWRLEDED